jgi:hypothetical protein
MTVRPRQKYCKYICISISLCLHECISLKRPTTGESSFFLCAWFFRPTGAPYQIFCKWTYVEFSTLNQSLLAWIESRAHHVFQFIVVFCHARPNWFRWTRIIVAIPRNVQDQQGIRHFGTRQNVRYEQFLELILGQCYFKHPSKMIDLAPWTFCLIFGSKGGNPSYIFCRRFITEIEAPRSLKVLQTVARHRRRFSSIIGTSVHTQ